MGNLPLVFIRLSRNIPNTFYFLNVLIHTFPPEYYSLHSIENALRIKNSAGRLWTAFGFLERRGWWGFVGGDDEGIHFCVLSPG